MPDNTHRFTGRAEDYDRYRQRYPTADILAHLRSWCGLTPQWLVADIGAGTGMLAEVFLANHNRVLAIEPNPDMRTRMSELFGPNTTPQLEIIDATAEATTLPSTSIDLVAAGRAFHWFDQQRALAEFRRILKPRGWVALVSLGRTRAENDKNEIDPALRDQLAAFEHLLTTHGTDYAYVRSGYRVHENLRALFGHHSGFEAVLHQAQLPGFQQLDWSAFRGQAMSYSVVPQRAHPNYEVFQRELRLFFDIHAPTGILTLPTTCYITAVRLAP
jgi:ubiquinone/menaquinone biosynthesis C-methylase UbiE